MNDLLDIERITHGKLQLRLQHVLLAEVLAGAVEVCRPLLEERKHEFVTDLRAADLVVNGDPDRSRSRGTPRARTPRHPWLKLGR